MGSMANVKEAWRDKDSCGRMKRSEKWQVYVSAKKSRRGVPKSRATRSGGGPLQRERNARNRVGGKSCGCDLPHFYLPQSGKAESRPERK